MGIDAQGCLFYGALLPQDERFVRMLDDPSDADTALLKVLDERCAATLGVLVDTRDRAFYYVSTVEHIVYDGNPGEMKPGDFKVGSQWDKMLREALIHLGVHPAGVRIGWYMGAQVC